MRARFARNSFTFASTDVLNEYHMHTEKHFTDKGKVAQITSHPRDDNTNMVLRYKHAVLPVRLPINTIANGLALFPTSTQTPSAAALSS